MGVGLRLKSILRDKKMTIKKLSELTNISINTLYSITKRDSERVDIIILHRIADVLGVSVTELAGYPIIEAIDPDLLEAHPEFAPKTLTFQPVTPEDAQLIELGGFGAVVEFYRLPEESQAKAREDIRGFVEYIIEKYKNQSAEDKKTPPQPE